MKLLRFGKVGEERPGLLDSKGNIRDLSSVVDDINGAAISDERPGRDPCNRCERVANR